MSINMPIPPLGGRLDLKLLKEIIMLDSMSLQRLPTTMFSPWKSNSKVFADVILMGTFVVKMPASGFCGTCIYTLMGCLVISDGKVR